ncbi:MAG: substrate-binding domain-containing protein [Bacteroidia bacterium]
MINVNVGGVPEHFNLAWHLAIEQGSFSRKGIRLHWNDIPGGTGAMCTALRTGELDIAIALTEGMIADIVQGNPSRIVQFYVNSPLRWGIYVSANSPIRSPEEMHGYTYAVSRFKSGSHLMAYVNADKHNFTLNPDEFTVVGNLDGARKALKEDVAQLFLWEKFTTKPYVDSGEFRMIGECATPWPCFVIAVSNRFIASHEDALKEILSIINLSCMLLQNNSNAPHLIASRYGIREADALQWFQELEYACKPEIEVSQLQEILNNLLNLKIIHTLPLPEEVCYMPNLVMLDN